MNHSEVEIAVIAFRDAPSAGKMFRCSIAFCSAWLPAPTETIYKSGVTELPCTKLWRHADFPDYQETTIVVQSGLQLIHIEYVADGDNEALALKVLNLLTKQSVDRHKVK